MVLTDVTSILKVLLAAFSAVAAQDELTLRRIGQLGEILGAAEDIGKIENKPGTPTPLERIAEAHSILGRVAAILAAEPQPAPQDDAIPVEYGWNGKLPAGATLLGEEEVIEEGFTR